MATLTIKRLPDEVYQALKDRAERHRRSINSEAIVLLERALGARQRHAETVIDQAETLNERRDQPLPDLISKARREGRS